MDDITNALERIADELSPCYEGKLVVRNFVPSFTTFPIPSNVINRVSCLEEQREAKLWGVIPYKKRKTLVSVCETWLFYEDAGRKVAVAYLDPMAEESARKHLAEYM